ncbi:MAG: TraR/DksA family transcriptional regulator [Candidatus Binataceae bacterium]
MDENRLAALRQILTRSRNETLARVREIRQEQEQDALPLPIDEQDDARSLADVETHASLIERAEFRIKAIDDALLRLERGLFGICEDCGREIPLKRLDALPFAACCVSCQGARDHAVRPGDGTMDAHSGRRWAVPEEMDESLEKQESLTSPEEKLQVHEEQPFGPEVGEFEQLPPSPTTRRRGRLKKKE